MFVNWRTTYLYMPMLMSLWPWALFGSKFWIILQYCLERNVQNINGSQSSIDYAEVICCWFLLRSIVLQKVNQTVKSMQLDIFWFFFVYKQINSLEASLGINQFVFYSCAMIRYSINLWRRLIVLEESSTVTFSMEVWVSDWFDCYIWLWCKYTKRSSSINA